MSAWRTQDRPNPADGHAELIDLTKRGQDLMANAVLRVDDIEDRRSTVVGSEDFGHMCATMQRLLDELNPQQPRS